MNKELQQKLDDIDNEVCRLLTKRRSIPYSQQADWDKDEVRREGLEQKRRELLRNS